MTEPHTFFRTEDLQVGYGKSVLVKEIALHAQPGEVITLIGPNGAGKSTILKTFIRQLPPMGGAIYITGESLEQIEEKELSRTMSVLMTQRPQVELKSCYEVVSAGRYPYTGRFGMLTGQDDAKIREAMELVRIADLADTDFSRISDGQKQRVMLARAICQEPSLLVLDEPTSYLDIRYKLEFLQLIRSLAGEKKIAVIMSLHELELAKESSDYVVCVRNGRIDRCGSPEEVFSGDYIRELYEADEALFEQIYGNLVSRRSAFSHYVRSGTKQLRMGYTTGTCAALAAAGAARMLLGGEAPKTVSLLTPAGIEVEVEPVFCRMQSDTEAICGIRKDAGDDPDVTDGVIVVASVSRTHDDNQPSLTDEPGSYPGRIVIDGGEGVGRVTKPGLDQAVGEAAINHVPREMIRRQVASIASLFDCSEDFRVVISIPGGEELAARTLNSQLGITGGLSILGTGGIVEPMSEQALRDSIEIVLRQAKAQGHKKIILTPGNYGEAFLQGDAFREKIRTEEIPVVKCSNFIGDTLDMAAALSFDEVLLAGHIGKMVKLAGGIMNTHSHQADCRMELFAAHAALAGAPQAIIEKIMQAVTTDACLEILQEAGLSEKVMESILEAIQKKVEQRVGGAYAVGTIVFSNRFGLLGKTGIASRFANRQ
ncbi:MAG: cobalamin biosynthesis protein CbiD [Lachnospiraceae bacterium]|nr:cobalamin biosynthesis protein CbiD [Lachnospiraceae bacterium]